MPYVLILVSEIRRSLILCAKEAIDKPLIKAESNHFVSKTDASDNGFIADAGDDETDYSLTRVLIQTGNNLEEDELPPGTSRAGPKPEMIIQNPTTWLDSLTMPHISFWSPRDLGRGPEWQTEPEQS